MQLVEQRTPRIFEPTITVGPSIAVELAWVLLATRRDQLCVTHPGLETLYRSPNGLRARVLSFWGDDVGDFGEQLILADQAGVLGSLEIEELLAGISGAATHSPKELPLRSEDEADRAVFLQRLDRLRRSSKLRRDYVALLADLWDEVGGNWLTSAKRLVDTASERYRHRIERGERWLDIVMSDSEHLSKLLPGLLERAAPVDAVMIVPSFFSGQGLLFDLPSGVLVGVRASGMDPSSRARTDLLARRLRALADPTPARLVYSLSQATMTVGELARSFGLAQPTVSNHLKILREAGIVAGGRRGTRLELTLDPESTNDLLDDLRDLLNRPLKNETTEG